MQSSRFPVWKTVVVWSLSNTFDFPQKRGNFSRQFIVVGFIRRLRRFSGRNGAVVAARDSVWRSRFSAVWRSRRIATMYRENPGNCIVQFRGFSDTENPVFAVFVAVADRGADSAASAVSASPEIADVSGNQQIASLARFCGVAAVRGAAVCPKKGF
jgi:hypothetical protein